MNVGKSAGGPRCIIAFWARRFAGRAAITAAAADAAAAFGDACFFMEGSIQLCLKIAFQRASSCCDCGNWLLLCYLMSWLCFCGSKHQFVAVDPREEYSFL